MLCCSTDNPIAHGSGVLISNAGLEHRRTSRLAAAPSQAICALRMYHHRRRARRPRLRASMATWRANAARRPWLAGPARAAGLPLRRPRAPQRSLPAPRLRKMCCRLGPSGYSRLWGRTANLRLVDPHPDVWVAEVHDASPPVIATVIPISQRKLTRSQADAAAEAMLERVQTRAEASADAADATVLLQTLAPQRVVPPAYVF